MGKQGIYRTRFIFTLYHAFTRHRSSSSAGVVTNISSYEALTEHACNAMSKNYPIIVPFPAFHHVLRDALDAIGAFSLTNDAWAAIAQVGVHETAPGVHPVPEQPEGPDGDLSTPHEHIAWQTVAREVP